MFTKKLLNLSSPLKNLSFSPYNAIAYHLSHVENLKGTDNDDKLISELRASKLSKKLHLLNNNRQIVQGSHIIIAMSSFYHLMRKNASTFSDRHAEPINTNWADHVLYKEMSYIIKSNINKLSGSETLSILFYLKGVNGAFELQAILFEHLIKNLKDLSIKDFRLLTSLLKKFQKRSYIVNIERAVIKQFIFRLSMNHQKDNIEYLTDGIYVLSYNNYNSSAGLNKLLDLFVEDLSDYQNDIALHQALLIHETLCSLHYLPKKWVELLRKIEKSIASNINEMQACQINFIIYRITSRVKSFNGAKEFYNAAFIDKLILKLVHDDAGLESAVNALECLIYMRHYNREILNYVCASYFETTILKDVPIKNHKEKLLIMLSGLAHANYKSTLFNELENNILKEQNLLDHNPQSLCNLLLNAICLDRYPIKIFNKIFNSTFDFSHKGYFLWTFCKIYQKIQTNPLYQGPRPTESQIQNLKTFYERRYRERKTIHFPMLSYLVTEMGGPAYVKTNIGTKLFHLIDHVVAFDKDDLPIPLNSDINNRKTTDIEYLEDLQVPQQSKIIAVIMTQSCWYFKNTQTLIGPYKIFADTLEKMNYNVVDINILNWIQIPDEERQSFLASKIKSKLKTSITT